MVRDEISVFKELLWRIVLIFHCCWKRTSFFFSCRDSTQGLRKMKVSSKCYWSAALGPTYIKRGSRENNGEEGGTHLCQTPTWHLQSAHWSQIFCTNPLTGDLEAEKLTGWRDTTINIVYQLTKVWLKNSFTAENLFYLSATVLNNWLIMQGIFLCIIILFFQL